MNPLRRRQERVRFLRFMAVGVIGAVVDFGIFNLLTSLVNIPAVWASIISFTAAITSNFLWNRHWTYPDSRSKPISNQVLQFGLINFIGLAIRTPLFAVLENPLQRMFTSMELPQHLTARFLGHNLALAIAVSVIMLWNFFANRYWTYNDVA